MDDKILNDLNQEQQEACTRTEGAIRLIAGAGSGKTSVLTRRVAYISKEKNIEPYRILSLTFTNKAADEMRSRCSKLLKCKPNELSMMTFHSLALAICKEEMPRYMGWTNGVSVGNMPFYMYAELAVDELAPSGAIDENIRTYLKKRLANYISKVKNDGNYIKYYDTHNVPDVEISNPLEVYQYEKEKEQLQAERTRAIGRKRYLEQNIKKKNNPNLRTKNGETLEELDEIIEKLRHVTNSDILSPTATWALKAISLSGKVGVLTFDNLIDCALYLLSTYSEVLEKWQNKYDYIQVDEFQDTDLKQLKIIKLLYGRTENLFVVGDPDQSIYSFREGTDAEIFNQLMEYIPNLVTIYMHNNYRSSSEIVSIGNSVITLNKNRIRKDLISMSHSGEKIKILTADKVEGSYNISKLATKEFNEIQKLIANGVSPNDIAILYRDLNSEVTKELVDMLSKTDIPLDNQLIRMEYGSELLKNIENIYKFMFLRNQGDKRDADRFFNNFIGSINPTPTNFIFADEVYARLSELKDGGAIVKYISSLYMKLKYAEPESAVNSKRNPATHEESLSNLENSYNKWIHLTPKEKWAACTDESTLRTKTEEHTDGLHIMTYHAAKGLEYAYVIVNDIDTTSLLKLRPKDDIDVLEETVRLAYVAITRAKIGLIIGLSTPNSPYIAISKQDFVTWDNEEFKEELLLAGTATYTDKFKELAQARAYAVKYVDLGERKSSHPRTGDIIGTVLLIPYKGENYILRLKRMPPTKLPDTVTEFRINDDSILSMELEGAYLRADVTNAKDINWIDRHYEDDNFLDFPIAQKYLMPLIEKDIRSTAEYKEDLAEKTRMLYNRLGKRDESVVLYGEKPIDKNSKPYIPFSYEEFIGLNQEKRQYKNITFCRIDYLNLTKDICTLLSNLGRETLQIRQLIFEISGNNRICLTNPSKLKDWKYWKPNNL